MLDVQESISFVVFFVSWLVIDSSEPIQNDSLRFSQPSILGQSPNLGPLDISLSMWTLRN